MLVYCIAKECATKPQWDVSLKTAQVLTMRLFSFRAVPFQDWDSDNVTLNKLSTADWPSSMQEKDK